MVEGRGLVNGQMSFFDAEEQEPKVDPLQYWVHLATGTPLNEVSSVPTSTLKEIYPDVFEYGPYPHIVKLFVRVLRQTKNLPESESTGLAAVVAELLNYGADTSWEYCARLEREDPSRLNVLQKKLGSLHIDLMKRVFKSVTLNDGAGRALVNLTCPDIFADDSIQKAGLVLLARAEAKVEETQKQNRMNIAIAHRKTAEEASNNAQSTIDYSQLVVKL